MRRHIQPGGPQRFVAVDVETASRRPPTICSIAAVRFEEGRETGFCNSLVCVAGPVRFTRIHGLTAHDLRQAPPWPAVWALVLETLAGIEDIVAFRAEFDRAAILSMNGRFGLRTPRLRFACVAEAVEAHLGQRVTLSGAMEALGLPFPGCPHTALADARAAGAIATVFAMPLPRARG